MAERLQLKRNSKDALVDGEPFVDKVNERLLLQMDNKEHQFVPLRNTVYVFKHVPITGTVDNPDLIEIVPGGGCDINSSQTINEGWTGNSRTVLPFEPANNYDELGYSIEIIEEQEERVINLYNTTYPKVSANKLLLNLYRTLFGSGYNGTDNCYCTIKIKKLF